MRQGMYYTTILHIWYKDYFILYLLYFYIEKLFISVRGNQLLLQMNLNRCRDFSHLSRFFWELSNFVINEWFVVGILRVSPSLSLCLPAVFQFFPRPEKREAYEKMCSRKFDIFFIYALPFRGKNYEKTLREKRKNNARQAAGPEGGVGEHLRKTVTVELTSQVKGRTNLSRKVARRLIGRGGGGNG